MVKRLDLGINAGRIGQGLCDPGPVALLLGVSLLIARIGIIVLLLVLVKIQ